MSITKHMAKLLRDVHFGGNWTWVSLKETMSEISWEESRTKFQSFNSIAALMYHMNYYVCAVMKVLEGGPLDAKDTYSWETPEFPSEEAWKLFLDKCWADAERLATLVEELPEELLWETFKEEKYGNYYRNIHGVIEHIHYHLGQVVIIKKMIGTS